MTAGWRCRPGPSGSRAATRSWSSSHAGRCSPGTGGNSCLPGQTVSRRLAATTRTGTDRSSPRGSSCSASARTAGSARSPRSATRSCSRNSACPWRWIRRAPRISSCEWRISRLATEGDPMSPVTSNTKRSIAWVVILTGIGSFMGALDTLVVSTALPTIRLDLGASVSQLEWTVNAYNLSFAVMLITAAALGDRFGRRRLYAVGLVGFAIASAGSALAPSVGALIVARALQGVAAAFILSLGLALLSAAFPPEKRGTAIGLFSAVTGLAVSSGPLVGGAVVNGLDWSWIFWLNVPIGLIAAPLVLTRMRESYGPDSALDLPGLGLISTAAFGIVWGLVRGNSVGWGSFEVIGTLAAGIALAAAFVAWEKRTTDPMIPISFFRSRAFAAGNIAIFTVLGSLFAEVYFFSQLLQNAMGYDALGAGLRLIPWTATFLVVGPTAGALTDRIGERPLMVSGLLIQAGASLWIALIASTDLAYS